MDCNLRLSRRRFLYRSGFAAGAGAISPADWPTVGAGFGLRADVGGDAGRGFTAAERRRNYDLVSERDCDRRPHFRD
ncbi:MAG: twin-arginine translocation signal domain-containing protein [Candidatus Kerfeldbacteria bacterium]|nr:twin-arginine translocation signal domain-containing protein [Candidatus Kerfeldbacteria bacterium]